MYYFIANFFYFVTQMTHVLHLVQLRVMTNTIHHLLVNYQGHIRRGHDVGICYHELFRSENNRCETEPND